MRKAGFTLVLLVGTFISKAQYLSDPKAAPAPDGPRYHSWWMIYATSAWVPKDVKIGDPGFGVGTSLLFPLNGKIYDYQCPVWLGLDFNYHYFGTEEINDWYVHYENWQLAFVARITSSDKRRFKPFMDVSLGGRYLASLTTDHRDYAGLAFRRGWLLAANAFNFASLGPTDFNISREYGKVSLIGSLAPGIRFIGRGKEWSGMTIKGYMQFGTSVHYLNRDSVHVRGNPMILSSEKRSGLMYGFQLGVTI